MNLFHMVLGWWIWWIYISKYFSKLIEMHNTKNDLQCCNAFCDNRTVIQIHGIISLMGLEKKGTDLNNFEKQYFDWKLEG